MAVECPNWHEVFMVIATIVSPGSTCNTPLKGIRGITSKRCPQATEFPGGAATDAD